MVRLGGADAALRWSRSNLIEMSRDASADVSLNSSRATWYPGETTRTTYEPNGSLSSVTGVRPRHRPFTVTDAPEGFDFTCRLPAVGAGGVGRAGSAGGLPVVFAGASPGTRGAVAGGETACSLYGFAAGSVRALVCAEAVGAVAGGPVRAADVDEDLASRLPRK